MLTEFRKFIAKGNVLELAVGLIMATYFGAIVKSLVNDIMMPPIGKMLGGVDFDRLKYVIQEKVPETVEGAGDGVAEVAITYGVFINSIITFLIVSFSVFLVIRGYNKMKARIEIRKDKEPAGPPTPSKEEVLLTEIRDLLQKR